MDFAIFIGGSDSIGGAGIQADIKFATLLNVYALTAITCVTAQNYLHVYEIENISLKNFLAQIRAIKIANLPTQYAKVSLLPDYKYADIIINNLSDYRLIIDTVFISKSKQMFLTKTNIFKTANIFYSTSYLITCNLFEFAFLLEINVGSITKNNIEELIYCFVKKFNIKNIIIRNLFWTNKNNVNILYSVNNSKFFYEVYEKFNTDKLHGTGCTFAAILTCFLIKGKSLSAALKLATHALLRILKMNNSNNNFKGLQIPFDLS